MSEWLKRVVEREKHSVPHASYFVLNVHYLIFKTKISFSGLIEQSQICFTSDSVAFSPFISTIWKVISLLSQHNSSVMDRAEIMLTYRGNITYLNSELSFTVCFSVLKLQW